MTGRRAGDVRKEKGGLAGELGAVDDAGKTGVYMTSRTHPLLPFRPHRKGGTGHTHEKSLPGCPTGCRGGRGRNDPKKKEAAAYSPALHCSTIGASGLNFSVRNGKRWDTTAITT